MARNIALTPVTPSFVAEGVNVILMERLLQALFGEKWWTTQIDTQIAGTQAWMKRQGAHYYAAERWSYDEDGHLNGRDFSVNKGISEAKRFGARTVVCEDLS